MADKRPPQPTLRVPFSDAILKSLPPADPGRRRHVLAEGEPHLLLRVTDKGSKTFYVNRRAAGSSRPVMVKLCPFRLDRNGRGNLPEARRLAVEATKALDAGLHPRDAARRKERHLFGPVCEDFIQHLHARNLRQTRQVEGTLRRAFLGQRPKRVRDFGKREWRTTWVNVEPGWRNKELNTVDRQAIRQRLQAAAQRNIWACRAAHAALRRLFHWAVEQELIMHSPLEGMRAQSYGVDKRLLRRRVTLSHDELRAVWSAAGEMGTYGTLVRVLMLSGQRLSDWARARRSELVKDDGMHLLVVPAERFKSGEPHECPVTPRVHELLGGLPAFQGSDWLFTVSGLRAFNDFSRAKAQLDKLSGTSGWCLHDLRRTCRTNLGTLGVPTEISERVIGHSASTLVDTYDRGSYRDQKMAALLKWETKLLEIVGDA